jgi:Pectate lyase superfamily protein
VRLHIDNVSSFGLTNPITILAANATECEFAEPLPSWVEEIAAPNTLAITVNPNTPQWFIIWVTAYTPGATVATIQMGVEGTTGAVAYNAQWVHGLTALDISSAPSYNVVDYGIDMTGETDSTTAFSALVGIVNAAGGGTINFPAGVCLLSNYVGQVIQTPIRLIGAGKGITIIRANANGICVNFQQPSYADQITFDLDLTASCGLQQSTSLIDALKYSGNCAVASGPTSTVAAASNGVSIAGPAFLAGTGVINLGSIPTNLPASGTVMVDCIEGDLGCTASLTYDGISGNELQNCLLTSTVGNGLMLTGNQVQFPVSSAVSGYVATTGTSVAGSPTVDVASASGVAWGMAVCGPGCPFGSGITVQSVAGDTVTLSANAGVSVANVTLNGTTTATVPTGSGGFPNVAAGDTVTGTGIQAGTTVISVSNSTMLLSAPATAGVVTLTFAGTGAFTFLPTNTVQIAGNRIGDLQARSTELVPPTTTCIGTVGGVGADTAVGTDVFGSALSGYFQVAAIGEVQGAVWDGTYTWVPTLTSPTEVAPFYPDRNITGKTATIGTAFNFIGEHGIGNCDFINQPSKSATAGPHNVVDYAAVCLHSLLCQGGTRPAGYNGSRYQIECLSFDELVSGPGNISQQIEGLNWLNVTNVQGRRVLMKYPGGGPAFGQNGNASLRIGPNSYGCDNVDIADILYDIGPPTSQGITVSGVQLTEGSVTALVTSGGFPNVSVGNTVTDANGGSHLQPNTTVDLVSGNTLTLSAPAAASGTILLGFSGEGLTGTYKDSLVVTKSGGSLGRTAIGILRISDPFYVAGPCFLQGSKVEIAVTDIQVGSPAYIQTATAAGQILKLTNGVLGGGIQVQNAAGMTLDLGHCRVYPAWGPGTHGTGCIELVSGSAPLGSAPLTLISEGVIWDYNFLATMVNPITGTTNLTLDAHVTGGKIANAVTTVASVTMNGTATATATSFAGVAPGETVFCTTPGLIPAGTTVSQVNGTSITLSQAAGTGEGTLVFQGTPASAALSSAGTYTPASRVNGVAGMQGPIAITQPSGPAPFVYGPLGVDAVFYVKANSAGTTDFYTGAMGSSNEIHIPDSALVTIGPVGAGDTLTLTYSTGDAPVSVLALAT